MIGTFVNVGAILVGGTIGLLVSKELSSKAQIRLKMLLGVFIIYAGLSTTFQAMHGPFLHGLKQLVVIGLALVFGNLIGRGLKLQKGVNFLGRWARVRFEASTTSPDSPNRISEGFVTCTLLFCVGPMAILGSLQDGLTGKIDTLVLKSVLDGLASLAFVRTFGWGVLLSAIPVLAYQGSITLGAQAIQPFLANVEMMSAVNATGGLLVLCISMLVLDVRKVPIANYLPSLPLAALLAKFIWP